MVCREDLPMVHHDNVAIGLENQTDRKPYTWIVELTRHRESNPFKGVLYDFESRFAVSGREWTSRDPVSCLVDFDVNAVRHR